jgi:hypothetical protein
MGKYLSRRIRFSNWDPKGRPETRGENVFTNLIDGDGGVSEIEELVHAGKDDSPNETDDPSTEGRRRHRGIICVGNRRTDFWIWGFILKHRRRWVKIWVIVVIDSNVLSVPDQVCQLLSSFQSSWKEIEKKHYGPWHHFDDPCHGYRSRWTSSLHLPVRE